MGLEEVISTAEVRKPSDVGTLERFIRLTFTTEATSGSFTVDVPADDYDPEQARDRVAERAEAIDAGIEA